MTLLHIGIDDTDSPHSMCTSYLGAVLIEKLHKMSVKTIDYPKWVRLNPNIPYRTRGNAAVSLQVKLPQKKIAPAKKIVLETVEEMSDLRDENTNPGIAFLPSDIPPELEAFAREVIQDVVTIPEAEAIAKDVGAEIHKIKNGRGIIGALAAIGETLKTDHTFELLTYRVTENYGKPRRIDEKSVFAADRETYPETFDNVDWEENKQIITPHGQSPVLYGVRGENPTAVLKAYNIVKSYEPIERHLLYKSNQATDAHLRKVKHIKEIVPYWSVIVKGEVCQAPKTIVGGHVIFTLKDDDGKIDCAAYEPTGDFRKIVHELHEGDEVCVYGGVKPTKNEKLTINLEKLRVIDLIPIRKKISPACPKCNKTMTSAGRGKGYKCKKCGARLPEKATKYRQIRRGMKKGIYEVAPQARRHISKPLVRGNIIPC